MRIQKGRQRPFVALVAAGLLVCAAPTLRANQAGEYVGRVVAEWLKDGREMKLVEDFAFKDSGGKVWKAPSGSVVDGASIPALAWPVIGGPFEGKYRDASVIHDVACDAQSEPWEDVHEVFYQAMLASGVATLKARVMYGAVYHFGPRWERRFTRKEIPARDAPRRIKELAEMSNEVRTVVATAGNRRMVGGGGGPLASQGRDPPQEVVDLAVRVMPKKSALKDQEFADLKAAIESKDLNLAQIRAFKP